MTDATPDKGHRGRGDRKAQQKRTRARKRKKHGSELRAKAKATRIRRVTRPAFADKPVVTIFADASYLSGVKGGSWGVWIKADGRPALVKGGTFLGEITSSVEAEMRALGNALALARAAGFLPDGACAMVQSDCQSALSWVLGAVATSCHRPAPNGLKVHPAQRPAKALRESAGLRAFVALAAKAGLKIIVRHVPGHKSGAGRAYVNRLVDAVAKQHRPKPQEDAHEA